MGASAARLPCLRFFGYFQDFRWSQDSRNVVQHVSICMISTVRNVTKIPPQSNTFRETAHCVFKIFTAAGLSTEIPKCLRIFPSGQNYGEQSSNPAIRQATPIRQATQPPMHPILYVRPATNPSDNPSTRATTNPVSPPSNNVLHSE